METPAVTPLERACTVALGSSRLAELLTQRLRARGSERTVSKASISRWKKEQVPAEMCPDVEAITGVRCEELRPEVDWSVLRKATKARA